MVKAMRAIKAKTLIMNGTKDLLNPEYEPADAARDGRLVDLQVRTQAALVLISHDLAVVRQVCETVAVMRDGRIVERGPVEEVWHHPSDPFTRALLEATATLP